MLISCFLALLLDPYAPTSPENQAKCDLQRSRLGTLPADTVIEWVDCFATNAEGEEMHDAGLVQILHHVKSRSV